MVSLRHTGFLCFYPSGPRHGLKSSALMFVLPLSSYSFLLQRPWLPAAAPIALLESFDLSFDHGDYSGYKEFLNFDMHASKLEDIEAKYNLTQVGTRVS